MKFNAQSLQSYPIENGCHKVSVPVDLNSGESSPEEGFSEGIQRFRRAFQRDLESHCYAKLRILQSEITERLAQTMGSIISIEAIDAGDAPVLEKGEVAATKTLKIGLSPASEKHSAGFVDLANILEQVAIILKVAGPTLNFEQENELDAFWERDSEAETPSDFIKLMEEYRSHIAQLGVSIDVPFEKVVCLEDVFSEEVIAPKIVVLLSRDEAIKKRERKRAIVFLLGALVIAFAIVYSSQRLSAEREEEGKVIEKKPLSDSERLAKIQAEMTINSSLLVMVSKHFYRFIASGRGESGFITPVITDLPYEVFTPPVLVINTEVVDLFRKASQKKDLKAEDVPGYYRSLVKRKASNLKKHKMRSVGFEGVTCMTAKGADDEMGYLELIISKKGDDPRKGYLEKISAIKLFPDIFSVSYSYPPVGIIHAWINLKSGRVSYWDGGKVKYQDFNATGRRIKEEIGDLSGLLIGLSSRAIRPFKGLIEVENNGEDLVYKTYPQFLLPDFHREKASKKEAGDEARAIAFMAPFASQKGAFIHVSHRGKGEFASRVITHQDSFVIYPDLITTSQKNIHQISYLSLASLASNIKDIQTSFKSGKKFHLSQDIPDCIKISNDSQGTIYKATGGSSSLRFERAYCFLGFEDRVDFFFRHQSGVSVQVILSRDEEDKASFYVFDGETIRKKDFSNMIPDASKTVMKEIFEKNSRQIIAEASGFVAPFVSSRLSEKGHKKTLGLYSATLSQSK
jgi:hypothetical protein